MKQPKIIEQFCSTHRVGRDRTSEWLGIVVVGTPANSVAKMKITLHQEIILTLPTISIKLYNVFISTVFCDNKIILRLSSCHIISSYSVGFKCKMLYCTLSLLAAVLYSYYGNKLYIKRKRYKSWKKQAIARTAVKCWTNKWILQFNL